MKPITMTPEQVSHLQYTLSLIHNERQWEVFLTQVRDLADEQTVEDVAALARQLRETTARSDTDVVTAITQILEAGLTRKWLDRYMTGYLAGQDFDPTKPGH